MKRFALICVLLLVGCAAPGPAFPAGPVLGPPDTVVPSITPSPTLPAVLASPTARAVAPTATLAHTPTAPRPTATPAPDTSVLAAGDIAECGSGHDEATAALLSRLPGAILTLGDEAYPGGSPAEFAQCYAPSWGQFKSRTYPAPGNHEYVTAGAAGYFGYFGRAAGPAGLGYYSFDLGAWHLVALNSELEVGTGSPQEEWLRADLAAHPRTCTLAYWHQPRFSSGPHSSNSLYQPLWQALYQASAEIVLNGHDHDYERFAPQTPDGQPDAARGLREFVVGTGGAGLYPFVQIMPNSDVRLDNTWGVLQLTLHARSYDWRFLSAPDGRVLDSGSDQCH